jgi:transposase
MLPRDFPKWELVYYYFNKWKCDGTIKEIHERLRDSTRKRAGKESSPSLGLIDSQSVKTTRMAGYVEELMVSKRQKEESDILLLILWDYLWL